MAQYFVGINQLYQANSATIDKQYECHEIQSQDCRSDDSKYKELKDSQITLDQALKEGYIKTIYITSEFDMQLKELNRDSNSKTGAFIKPAQLYMLAETLQYFKDILLVSVFWFLQSDVSILIKLPSPGQYKDIAFLLDGYRIKPMHNHLPPSNENFFRILRTLKILRPINHLAIYINYLMNNWNHNRNVIRFFTESRNLPAQIEAVILGAQGIYLPYHYILAKRRSMPLRPDKLRNSLRGLHNKFRFLLQEQYQMKPFPAELFHQILHQYYCSTNFENILGIVEGCHILFHDYFTIFNAQFQKYYMTTERLLEINKGLHGYHTYLFCKFRGISIPEPIREIYQSPATYMQKEKEWDPAVKQSGINYKNWPLQKILNQ